MVKIIRDKKGRFVKGTSGYMRGKSHSSETRKRLSKSKIGPTNPAKRKDVRIKMSIAATGRKHSSETKKKISSKLKGHPNYLIKHSEETKRKMSKTQQKILTPELIKKRLAPRGKSSLEIKFEEIINRLRLPYGFVGNGKVLINKKCPDFINTDGKKIAIEVYYRKHKEIFRNGLGAWRTERTEIFSDNGWELIFFDETQVNEKQILSVLGGEKLLT